jgi:hypothetical protein
MSWDQVFIVVFGVGAVFLSQTERYKRWACVFGLFGQPAWFYAAIEGGQPGIFIVCVLYTLAWLKGVWTYWIAPHRAIAGRIVLPAKTIVKLHGIPCELESPTPVFSNTIAKYPSVAAFERVWAPERTCEPLEATYRARLRQRDIGGSNA